MASCLWRKYAGYLYTKWERTILLDMIEPYGRPKSFIPLVNICIVASYTRVIDAAITEQLYKTSRRDLCDLLCGSNTRMETCFYGISSRMENFGLQCLWALQCSVSVDPFRTYRL